jgi:hypothetical protein
MSDGVVIPLDVDDTKARSKVARLKKDAAGAGRAFGQAGAQAARVGGAAGGALGRSIGGFSQGMGGMLLSSFLQRDGERQTMAREREARNQGRAADARSVMKSKDDLAAGGLNFLGAARRIVSRGDDAGLLNAKVGVGKSYGLTMAESLSAVDYAKVNNMDSGSIMAGMSTGMVGSSPAEVGENIRKFNGLQNAVAALGNMTNEEAGAAIGRMHSDPRSAKLARAGAAMTPVEQAQLDALMSGDTARVLENQARDTLDPGRRLMLEASQKMMDSVNLQRAAADAQSGVAALLAEAGRVVGLSDGSAARQLAVGASAASE